MSSAEFQYWEVFCTEPAIGLVDVLQCVCFEQFFITAWTLRFFTPHIRLSDLDPSKEGIVMRRSQGMENAKTTENVLLRSSVSERRIMKEWLEGLSHLSRTSECT